MDLFKYVISTSYRHTHTRHFFNFVIQVGFFSYRCSRWQHILSFWVGGGDLHLQMEVQVQFRASANRSIGNGSIGKQTTENWFSTIPTCDGKRTKPNRVRSSRVGASSKEAISFIFLFLSPTGDFGVSRQCGQKKIVKYVVCHRGSTLVAAILGGFGVKCLNAELSSKQARLASGSLVLMNIQIKLGFSVIKPGAQTS